MRQLLLILFSIAALPLYAQLADDWVRLHTYATSISVDSLSGRVFKMEGCVLTVSKHN
ncbi:hypothetical protein [Spirosoma litoris]